MSKLYPHCHWRPRPNIRLLPRRVLTAKDCLLLLIKIVFTLYLYWIYFVIPKIKGLKNYSQSPRWYLFARKKTYNIKIKPCWYTGYTKTVCLPGNTVFSFYSCSYKKNLYVIVCAIVQINIPANCGVLWGYPCAILPAALQCVVCMCESYCQLCLLWC